MNHRVINLRVPKFLFREGEEILEISLEGKIYRKIFTAVEILSSEKTSLEELKSSFTETELGFKPDFWTDHDYLRFLSCKNYDVPGTKKVLLENWAWSK